jgi:hypothetical protein
LVSAVPPSPSSSRLSPESAQPKLQTPTQIRKLGILPPDQPNFLLSSPTLQLLLPRNGRPNITERLKVNESLHSVFFGKPRNASGSMLHDASLEEIGNAYVQHAGGVG